MDNERYFLVSVDGQIVVRVFDDNDYSGLSSDQDLWFTTGMFDSQQDADEAADIINALINDVRGRHVLMRRLMKLI